MDGKVGVRREAAERKSFGALGAPSGWGRGFAGGEGAHRGKRASVASSESENEGERLAKKIWGLTWTCGYECLTRQLSTT